MLLSVVFTFALLFVAAGNGKSTNCPDFVPTTKDTASFVGTFYATHYATIGRGQSLLRCVKKVNEVNSYGTINSNYTYMATDSNEIKNFTSIMIPIDHVRTRFSYVYSLEPNNAEIHVLLDIVPDYAMWGFCQTIDGQLEYSVSVNTKERVVAKELLDQVKAFLRASNLVDDLKSFDQTNCSN